MLNLNTFFIKLFNIVSGLLHLILGANRHGLPRRSDTLANIKIKQLLNSGFKGVILDLDNTIVSEDDRYLSPGAEKWIKYAKLAGLKFYILSNGKRHYRVKYWSNRLNIPAIHPAKKPFPPAFRSAFARLQLPPKQVVVIGDGLHTDILGALLCGCFSIQVASLPHPLRWWEKLGGKWLQIPYPKEAEIWEFDARYY